MDEVASSLLENVPVGDELKDPREGAYKRAMLSAVEGKTYDSGASAILMTFVGLTDQEGREFSYTHAAFFPSQDAENWQKFAFLAFLHDIGIVDRKDSKERIVETQEAKDIVVSAVKAQIGTVFSIRLAPDKGGQLRLRFLRS